MTEQNSQTAETAPATQAPAGLGIPVGSAPPPGKRTYIWGVGRRKSAVARVRLALGSGKIEVNGRTLNEYFTAEKDRKAIFGPLEVTNTGGKMDVLVNATGGGPTGQTGAIVMGLGRALAKFDTALEGSLRQAGFLTRDSRMKERKKYGQRGARRRFQFSKR
ncbi:MAG TPA: 30S ribosomal protein S9 [Tepidisphaeraceae bacterium]|nr:30S ribosomal protein S9 [Tepidisphaeraceae bacterium]